MRIALFLIMNPHLSYQPMFSKIRLTFMAIGLAFIAIPCVWAQTPSITTGCAGTLSAPMARIATPYLQALGTLNGSEAGWCAMAKKSSAQTPEAAAMWEFTSAAYVLHALRGLKRLAPAQQIALRKVLTQIPGIGEPPRQLKAIDTALYVHMRTLAANDSTDTLMTLFAIDEHSPAVYKTLMRRSVRWGDADDN